jgi:hypothetical protein
MDEVKVLSETTPNSASLDTALRCAILRHGRSMMRIRADQGVASTGWTEAPNFLPGASLESHPGKEPEHVIQRFSLDLVRRN